MFPKSMQYIYCCYFIWWRPFIPSRNYMKFSLITIYGSNVPSNLRSCQCIHGFNESRSFIYTKLYKITYKYYFKTYFNSPSKPLHTTHAIVKPHMMFIYIYIIYDINKNNRCIIQFLLKDEYICY